MLPYVPVEILIHSFTIDTLSPFATFYIDVCAVLMKVNITNKQAIFVIDTESVLKFLETSLMYLSLSHTHTHTPV